MHRTKPLRLRTCKASTQRDLICRKTRSSYRTLSTSWAYWASGTCCPLRTCSPLHRCKPLRLRTCKASTKRDLICRKTRSSYRTWSTSWAYWASGTSKPLKACCSCSALHRSKPLRLRTCKASTQRDLIRRKTRSSYWTLRASGTGLTSGSSGTNRAGRTRST